MPYRRKSPPRLSVEITEEQEKKLRELIPHGLKKHIFQQIVDDLIVVLEDENPYKIAGAIIDKKLRLEQFSGKQGEE